MISAGLERAQAIRNVVAYLEEGFGIPSSQKRAKEMAQTVCSDLDGYIVMDGNTYSAREFTPHANADNAVRALSNAAGFAISLSSAVVQPTFAITGHFNFAIRMARFLWTNSNPAESERQECVRAVGDAYKQITDEKRRLLRRIAELAVAAADRNGNGVSMQEIDAAEIAADEVLAIHGGSPNTGDAQLSDMIRTIILVQNKRKSISAKDMEGEAFPPSE